MRKVANILLVIYVVICGLILFGLVFGSSRPAYFEEVLWGLITLLTPGLFMYTIVRLLSIMDPVDELTIHKFAIILLAIYFLICVFLTLLDYGIRSSYSYPFFANMLVIFVVVLIPGLCIYIIPYLLYDTYKQFAFWKIMNIILLVLSTCLPLLFYGRI